METTTRSRMRNAIFITAMIFSSIGLPGAAQTNAPQLFAPIQIPSTATLMDVAYTADRQTLYLTLSESSRRHTIIESRLMNGGWSPYRVASFSGVWRDLEEVLTPDSQAMIFASNRPVEPGGKPLDAFFGGKYRPARGGNLWIVRRSGSGWGTPQRLPDAINANTSTFSPAVAGDGTLYFMRASGPKGAFHLFVARRVAGSYRKAEPAPFADNKYSEFDPAVAPDGSFVVFSSGRPPAAPKSVDLFISFNHGGRWTKPADLGQPIDAGRDDVEVRLSPDLKELCYSTAADPARLNAPIPASAPAHIVCMPFTERLRAMRAAV